MDRPPRSTAIPLLVVGLAVTGGCSSDPVAPEPPDQRAGSAFVVQGTAAKGRVTLDALWPNEDGRAWKYRARFASCGRPEPTFYPSESDVPPLPAIEDLIPLLGGRSPGRPTSGDSAVTCIGILGTYRLRFNGTVTTLSGVTAQNLEEIFIESDGTARRLSTPGTGHAFLRRLGEARPDLRRAIGSPTDGPATGHGFGPIFLHGNAWEKTERYIGTYGDLDRLLAWKFLDADVSPGASFVFQLVPSLADDVFLHALVVPRRFRHPVRGFPRAVQVAYMIDYGILEARDAAGELIGFERPIDYGAVTYAPGVGPIASLEYYGAATDDPRGWSFVTQLDLRETRPGAALLEMAGHP